MNPRSVTKSPGTLFTIIGSKEVSAERSIVSLLIIVTSRGSNSTFVLAGAVTVAKGNMTVSAIVAVADNAIAAKIVESDIFS